MPGNFIDLQRANHPPDVVGLNAGRRHRVDLGQPRVQRRRAVLLGLSLERGTQLGPRRDARNIPAL